MGYSVNKVMSPNQRKGRGGKKIIAIVDHITAGIFPGCLNWMCNPKAKASAHYLITKAGWIYQLVKDEDTAWHAGAVNNPTWKLYDGTNPNGYTIGIEHENLEGGRLTEEQYQATLWLHRQLIAKHNIPADREHIIGHCEIDSVNRMGCPGKYFPWDRLMKDLKGEKEMAEVRYNAIEEIPSWGKETVKDLVERGILSGNGKNLDLSPDMVRMLVIMKRIEDSKQ